MMLERTVDLAVVQMRMRRVAGFDAFAHHVCELLDAAAGADVVLLPEWLTLELFTALPSWRELSIGELRALEGYSLSLKGLLKAEAVRRDQVIAGGSMLVESELGLVNAAHVFFPDGRVVANAKTHCVPVERTWETVEGDGLCVFEAAGVTFGLALCYEVEFGELVGALADHGVQVLLVPALSRDEPGYWRLRHCAAARAVEHQAYVGLAGLVGELGGPLPTGWHRSAILAPCDEPWPSDGVLELAANGEETVLVRCLDIGQLEERRLLGPAPTARDRRRKRDWYERIRATPILTDE
jgi:predicted amidohydrolase